MCNLYLKYMVILYIFIDPLSYNENEMPLSSVS